VLCLVITGISTSKFPVVRTRWLNGFHRWVRNGKQITLTSYGRNFYVLHDLKYDYYHLAGQVGLVAIGNFGTTL
jgi:hypothetical protein